MAAPSRTQWLDYFALWRPSGVRKILVVALLVIGAALSVYGSLYALCLDGRGYTTETRNGVTYERAVPHYRYTDAFGPFWTDFLEACFEPAHRVDRVVRPKRWRAPILKTEFGCDEERRDGWPGRRLCDGPDTMCQRLCQFAGPFAKPPDPATLRCVSGPLSPHGGEG